MYLGGKNLQDIKYFRYVKTIQIRLRMIKCDIYSLNPFLSKKKNHKITCLGAKDQNWLLCPFCCQSTPYWQSGFFLLLIWQDPLRDHVHIYNEKVKDLPFMADNFCPPLNDLSIHKPQKDCLTKQSLNYLSFKDILYMQRRHLPMNSLFEEISLKLIVF